MMVESVDFTLADLAREVRQAAAERPEYAYPRTYCTYCWGDGVPGCIFGVALKRLGVDIAGLQNMAIGAYLRIWFHAEYAEYSPFDKVQSLQDSQVPWGDCVKALDDQYPA
jgi:hypothetical protein